MVDASVIQLQSIERTSPVLHVVLQTIFPSSQVQPAGRVISSHGSLLHENANNAQETRRKLSLIFLI